MHPFVSKAILFGALACLLVATAESQTVNTAEDVEVSHHSMLGRPRRFLNANNLLAIFDLSILLFAGSLCVVLPFSARAYSKSRTDFLDNPHARFSTVFLPTKSIDPYCIAMIVCWASWRGRELWQSPIITKIITLTVQSQASTIMHPCRTAQYAALRSASKPFLAIF